MTTSGPRSVRTTLTASGALTTAMLPVFLLGALSEQLRTDLGLDEAAIGAAVTVVFVAAGLTAAPVGRWTDRLGAAGALRIGVALAGLSTIAIGLTATAWWQLAVPLAVVGVAVGAIDTGAARAFADAVPIDRQGRAFGLKEASVPSASLLAGVALPTVAVVLGWRGTFVAAAVVAAIVLVALPRRGTSATADVPRTATGRTVPPHAAPAVPPHEAAAWSADVADVPDAGTPPVRTSLLAAAAGLGTAAATGAATFLAPAVLARGQTPAVAGATLVVASLASIAGRLVTGRWADRPDARTVPAVTAMQVVGGAAAVVLAAPTPPAVALPAAVVLLGAGWGWTGLVFLTVTRARPGAPAAAAGVVLTGLGLGGAAGPPVFGALAGRVSYGVAWAVTAAGLLAAAAFTSASDRSSPSRAARPAGRHG